MVADPDGCALCLDFDGTLSDIVEDPNGARPRPGVPLLLTNLARTFASVAVISGRPVQFLGEVLGRPAGVRLIGLYGLEWIDADGAGMVAPEAEPWREVIDRVVHDARQEAAPGVYVEPKGLTVTVHWRHAPAERHWAEEFAEAQVASRGLKSYRSGLSVELAPPLDVDKGTATLELVRGRRGAVAFGDDWGDLPVFAALSDLADKGMVVARVAVVHPESPPEVAAAADVVVQGAGGAVSLLQEMVEAARPGLNR
jgi:trehalose 6-phosphate phosphatase